MIDVFYYGNRMAIQKIICIKDVNFYGKVKILKFLINNKSTLNLKNDGQVYKQSC